jgi:hypothetical protein
LENFESHVYEKRSLFKIDEDRAAQSLGEGLIYFTGQYQSIKACENSWLQNIDRNYTFELLNLSSKIVY